MRDVMMIQRVGDRDKESWSVKGYAFTVPANPMSDRIQMVVEIYDEDSGIQHKEAAERVREADPEGVRGWLAEGCAQEGHQGIGSDVRRGVADADDDNGGQPDTGGICR